MPSLQIPFVKPGDVIREDIVNEFLEDLEDISESIQGTNVRREAISSFHLDLGSATSVFSDYMEFSPSPVPSDSFVIEEETLELVDAGTAWRIQDINTQIRDGDVIRVHASCLTGVPTVVAEDSDIFYFIIYVTDSTGLNTFTIGPPFCFSMLAHSDTGTVTTPSSITWNRHVINWEYIHEDDPFTVGSVYIRAAVTDDSNSVPVHVYNLAVSIDQA